MNQQSRFFKIAMRLINSHRNLHSPRLALHLDLNQIVNFHPFYFLLAITLISLYSWCYHWEILTTSWKPLNSWYSPLISYLVYSQGCSALVVDISIFLLSSLYSNENFYVPLLPLRLCFLASNLRIQYLPSQTLHFNIRPLLDLVLLLILKLRYTSFKQSKSQLAIPLLHYPLILLVHLLHFIGHLLLMINFIRWDHVIKK
jgi:hypothetical protein